MSVPFQSGLLRNEAFLFTIYYKILHLYTLIFGHRFREENAKTMSIHKLRHTLK